jgi:hypothetical protein
VIAKQLYVTHNHNIFSWSFSGWSSLVSFKRNWSVEVEKVATLLYVDKLLVQPFVSRSCHRLRFSFTSRVTLQWFTCQQRYKRNETEKHGAILVLDILFQESSWQIKMINCLSLIEFLFSIVWQLNHYTNITLDIAYCLKHILFFGARCFGTWFYMLLYYFCCLVVMFWIQRGEILWITCQYPEAVQ